jgi:hypothetical protein
LEGFLEEMAVLTYDS